LGSLFGPFPLLLSLDVKSLGLAQVADGFLHAFQLSVPHFFDLFAASFVLVPSGRQRLRYTFLEKNK
jgi:hypothetical protein